MEIRSYTELGAPKVGDGRIIEGYAVVFGQESRVLYDREKQRAFVEVIEKTNRKYHRVLSFLRRNLHREY